MSNSNEAKLFLADSVPFSTCGKYRTEKSRQVLTYEQVCSSDHELDAVQ